MSHNSHTTSKVLHIYATTNFLHAKLQLAVRFGDSLALAYPSMHCHSPPGSRRAKSYKLHARLISEQLLLEAKPSLDTCMVE